MLADKLITALKKSKRNDVAKVSKEEEAKED